MSVYNQGDKRPKMQCFVLAGFSCFLFVALPFCAWSETRQYIYDQQNRLTRVERENGTGVIDAHDSIGNRLVRTQGSFRENTPPNMPGDFFPADGATDLDGRNLMLKWSGTDTDSEDLLFFDLYFGTTATPPRYKSGLSATSLSLGPLMSDTTYYWKIVARDSVNNRTAAPLHHFQTRTDTGVLAEPEIISPTKGSYIVNKPVKLIWQPLAEPTPGTKVYYDIYLGTSSTPELFKSNYELTSLRIAELSEATTYYWKVVAKRKAGGDHQSSSVTSFTTIPVDHQLVDERPTGDTVLVADKGPYIIYGTLRIENGTLTIPAGTVVKMAKDAAIDIFGGFRALGTASQPVVFTSLENDNFFGDTNNNGAKTAAQEGDWRIITFLEDSAAYQTELNHCIVEYGGRSDNASIYLRNASPIVRNTTVRHSMGDGLETDWGAKPEILDSIFQDNNKNGIQISKSSPSITNTSFRSNGEYNIRIYEGTPVITQCTIADGGLGGIYFEEGAPTISANTLLGRSPFIFAADALGSAILKDNTLPEKETIDIKHGTVTHDAIWPKLAAKYRIIDTLNIDGADGEDRVTSLTLEPGVSLLFKNMQHGEGRLTIGGSGALIAIGSKEKPITFTSGSSEPHPGSWYGLKFVKSVTKDRSKLDHCIVEYAGTGYDGAIEINEASPTITNTTIRHNNAEGIIIRGGAATLSNVRLHDNQYHGLKIDSGTPVITNSFIFNNDRYGINILKGSLKIEFSAITNNKSGGIRVAEKAQTTTAPNNWWGDASGPEDKSDDTTEGGLYNPKGRGQGVTDKVFYKPWLTAPPEGTEK